MMRLVAILLFITFYMTLQQELVKIYYPKEKKFVNVQHLANNLNTSQIIYVGEQHDHKWGHKIELNLLELLHNPKTSTNIVVSLEMFERDVQHLIDGYLSNEISEEFMLKHSRPWPNYNTDYRPLVEYAKKNKLNVLASNIPRRYAAFVSSKKDDILFKMPDVEKSWMAEEIIALKDAYFTKFEKVMKGHVPEDKIWDYYKAQCIKDDTMAKSILEYLKANPTHKCIMYAGSFHVEESLGIVQKVDMKAKFPKLVIIIVPVEEDVKDPEKYAHLGDYIIFAPANN